MNAPTPSQETLLHMLPLAMLQPSPTNPRQRFDEAALADLAKSIKAQGVMQPLLVREITWRSAPAVRPANPWPFPTPSPTGFGVETCGDNAITEPSGRYEIIAGERRYRAANLAGLAEVPCFVRNLTDLQVLHAQVIENLQREDLHPLEEAEGYERLLKEHGTTANEKEQRVNVDKIAAEVGVSRATIYARLKLLALCPEAREAFLQGKLDASTALLIARIPVAKLQVQAMKAITEVAQYGDSMSAKGDTMSYRAARDHIQQNFMTDLERAPFPIKDAALLEKAGSCTDCTKRTGNQPELFDDVKSKDVCTDPVCFGMKKAAHIQKQAEAEGHAVITGKEAKKVIPNGQWNSRPSHDSGYALLSDHCPHDENNRTWEQVLGKKAFQPAKETGKPAVQKTLVENTHNGELVPTIKIEDALKRLREMGLEVTHKKDQPNKFAQDQAKEQAAKKARLDQVNAYRARLFDTLRQQVEANLSNADMNGLYRILAQFHFDEMAAEYGNEDKIERLIKIYLPDLHADADPVIAFQEHIPTLTTQQHFLLLIDMMMIREIHEGWNPDNQPEIMLDIAKEIGIDAAAIEQEVSAEVKAAQKAAAKAAKKTSTPEPAPAKKSVVWPFPTPA